MKLQDFNEFSVNEGILTHQQIEEIINDIAGFFDDCDIELTDKFDLIKFADEVGLNIRQAEMALVNLEDTDVMNDIAVGNYDTFDISDRSQFNDGYSGMMQDIFKRR